MGLHCRVLCSSEVNAETEKTQAFNLRTVVHIALTKWNVNMMHCPFVQSSHENPLAMWHSVPSPSLIQIRQAFFMIQHYRSLTSNKTDSTWDFLACALLTPRHIKTHMMTTINKSFKLVQHVPASQRAEAHHRCMVCANNGLQHVLQKCTEERENERERDADTRRVDMSDIILFYACWTEQEIVNAN